MRKEMKKAMALLLTAAIGLGSVACGGKTRDTASGEEAVTITIMQANSPDKAYFDKMGDAFTAKHPNIKVEVIAVPYDNFDSKLQTLVASGNAPDITTHVQAMGFMDFYSKDMLLDLSPYIAESGFDYKEAGIPENVMESSMMDGKIYGIPLNTFTSVLVYNKDIFDAAGVEYPPSDYEDKSWTYDKMVEMAKKLTSGEEGNKTYGLLWNWSGTTPAQDPQYFGSNMFNMDEENPAYAKSCNMKTTGVISAYQKMADLAFVEGISPSPAIQQAMAGTNDSEPFLSGRIAMAIEGGWILNGLNELPFKTGVAAIPIGADENVRDVLYTDPYFVMKDSKHPKEAFEFIKFMAGKEMQEQMIKDSEGNPPASTLALGTYYTYFEGVDRQDLENVIEGGLKYGVENIGHTIAGAGEINNLLINELANINNGTAQAADVCPEVGDKLDAVLQKTDPSFQK
ncbi:MAG: sugar ABC transporter substrate-binding protein [Lachnospiraceae bacterium]|nr:sugar ABC transporter substrate-binding protein [Lachnospiraceae bacterium]